jgi:hypothetical protein
MATHNASVSLSKTRYTVDSLTYLKNLSPKPATITISIPVMGKNVGWGMTDNLQVTVMVDNAPVSVKNMGAQMVRTTDARKLASGIRADSYTNTYKFSLAFTGRQAHSLKVTYSSGLGHAGLDGARRVIAYDTAGAGTWNGAVGQLNLSLHYNPRLVFQVFAAIPKEEWQISSTGAFVKETDVSGKSTEPLVFTYYPGGFDKLGG